MLEANLCNVVHRMPVLAPARRVLHSYSFAASLYRQYLCDNMVSQYLLSFTIGNGLTTVLFFLLWSTT
jgi:hypothetical protein